MTEIIRAFLVGGAICAVGQLFIDFTKLTPARILTGYVVAGVVLSALGLYRPLADFAGAGASVPLTGFGHALAEGMRKAVDENGFAGVFTGELTAAAGGIAAALLAGLAAYGLVRYRFPGRGLLYSLIMAGMMFPVFSTIIPVFRMEAVMGLAGTGNRWLSLLAVILPQIAGNLCFAIIILMGFIQSVPIELEESAYLDGCNVFQIYFHIIIPAAKSSFATVAIFAFLWSYNDLFTQSFFLRYPQERAITGLLNEISSQAGVNYGLMAASVVLVVIPVLIVYICLQKHIIKGLTAGAVKG